MRIILSFLFAAGLFLMPPAQAASLTVCNPAGQSEDGVYVDTILASSSGTAVDFPRADTETIEAADELLSPPKPTVRLKVSSRPAGKLARVTVAEIHGVDLAKGIVSELVTASMNIEPAHP